MLPWFQLLWSCVILFATFRFGLSVYGAACVFLFRFEISGRARGASNVHSLSSPRETTVRAVPLSQRQVSLLPFTLGQSYDDDYEEDDDDEDSLLAVVVEDADDAFTSSTSYYSTPRFHNEFFD